jgi:tRNA(fMet)-specific endonuclease VapC
VKPALVDTDILSMFFRGNRAVVSHFQTYLDEHPQINLSIVTYYEILSGLKHSNFDVLDGSLAVFCDVQ